MWGPCPKPSEVHIFKFRRNKGHLNKAEYETLVKKVYLDKYKRK